MIIERGSVRELSEADRWLELPNHILHWRGVVYLPGHAAGADSLARLDWSRGTAAASEAVRRLKGCFLLSVTERTGPGHWVLVDAGGRFKAYVGGGTVATSFLELCAEKRLGFEDLDPDGVVEFLDIGVVHEGRTVAADIRKLEPGRAYELLSEAPPIVHDAGVPAIYEPPGEGTSLEGHFADLAVALEGARVSVDLTGGADSRLVAALLDTSVVSEFALSGSPGNTDIAIAAELAEILDRPLRVSYHRVDDLERELGDLFAASDGVCDIMSFHRVWQNAVARRARGVQIAVSGLGGELYKDFWWLQDFPRYRTKSSNLDRLFNFRFRPIALPDDLLTGEYARAAGEVRPRIMAGMRRRLMPINTQTYDRIYYEMRFHSLSFHSVLAGVVPQDAPLLDPELVRIGFALPRSQRAFNRFHRRLTSAASPALARIATTQGGMSLATGPRQAGDAVRYGVNGARRFKEKVRERVTQTPLRQELPDDPALIPTARATPAFESAVARLQHAGVISTALVSDAVPNRLVGRILTLGMLAERLDASRAVPEVARPTPVGAPSR